ncbi:MAG: heme ABC exporter ATP-binding protein CcmA [Alphaproteobacteria bacterium]|nr:heme ABC exporter ATP-binding protein CcmA [Alphaproteobacteria bacterium]
MKTVLHIHKITHPFIPMTRGAPLSIDLLAGQMLVITGGNGSGKSTLLKIIAGILAPLSGKIEASDLFYCGHETGLKQNLTVMDNLFFRQAVYGLNRDKKSVQNALDSFNMGSFEQRAINTLSKGQQQKIALASAILSPHPLWVLDEPTANLDAASVLTAESIFQTHLENGGAIIKSSHNEASLFLHNLRLESPTH